VAHLGRRLWRNLWLGGCLWLVVLTGAQAAFTPLSCQLTSYPGWLSSSGFPKASPEAVAIAYADAYNAMAGYVGQRLNGSCSGSGGAGSYACPMEGRNSVNHAWGSDGNLAGVTCSVPTTIPNGQCSGGSCTCNSGYSEDSDPQGGTSRTSVCSQDPPPVCPDAGTPQAGSSAGSQADAYNSGAGRTQTCQGGCLYQGRGGADVSGHYFAFGPFTATGANCTANENESTPPPACNPPQVPNIGGGCTTPSTTTAPPSVTENPDGSTTVRETQCNGTTCTTTETNTPSGGGGGSTTTTTQGINEYCAANPNVALCADVGSLPGGGGGGDGETCTGTPEQCACEANPSGAGCGGTPGGIGDYMGDAEGSLQGRMAAFRTAVGNTPVGDAVGGFFTVSVSASCPTYSAAIPIIGTITFDQLCSTMGTTVLTALRYAFLIVCAFFAFRVAIDN